MSQKPATHTHPGGLLPCSSIPYPFTAPCPLESFPQQGSLPPCATLDPPIPYLLRTRPPSSSSPPSSPLFQKPASLALLERPLGFFSLTAAQGRQWRAGVSDSEHCSVFSFASAGQYAVGNGRMKGPHSSLPFSHQKEMVARISVYLQLPTLIRPRLHGVCDSAAPHVHLINHTSCECVLARGAVLGQCI